METFAKLFGSLLVFVYHCFDRVVILGYMPLLIRPANIVYLLRDLRRGPDGNAPPITREMLRQRTDEYNAWVDAYRRKNDIPMEWAGKIDRFKDHLKPERERRIKEGRFGVYHILKTMEVGPSFGIRMPKHPTGDPNYRIVSSQRSRYTHYYFYILDPVLGPMSMCVGSFLPFHCTFWINGHDFAERELKRDKVGYRKSDNAFLSVDDPAKLQAACDRLSAKIVEERLNYWSLAVGPKFSEKERAAINLNRNFSIQQVEYCWNFVFKRNTAIHKLYERACDIGLARLGADKILNIFGFRKDRRMRGKLQGVVEKIDHGHHVMRACAKSAVARMYEKFCTFLRVEVLSNNVRQFGAKKSLEHLDKVRSELSAATGRYAGFVAECMDVHVEFPLFQRLALPIPVGEADADGKFKTKIPGIKIHDTRMIRLMEVLLHAGTRIHAWKTAQMHRAVLEAFGLKPDEYTLNQLRYDLRKLRAHGLAERDGKRYAYRLADKGTKASLMFVLFHKRVCGPLAGSLFVRAPQGTKPATKLEAAYTKADKSIGEILKLLEA